MPFADSLAPDSVQAIQAVLLAIVAAWVAVRTRQLDAAAREADIRADVDRERCEQIEQRVKALEKARKRSRRGKRPPKRPPPRKRK